MIYPLFGGQATIVGFIKQHPPQIYDVSNESTLCCLIYKIFVRESGVELLIQLNQQVEQRLQKKRLLDYKYEWNNLLNSHSNHDILSNCYCCRQHDQVLTALRAERPEIYYGNKAGDSHQFKVNAISKIIESTIIAEYEYCRLQNYPK